LKSFKYSACSLKLCEMEENKNLNKIREEIFEKIREYYFLQEKKKFNPGKSIVFYSGAVMDEKETLSVVDTILDGWIGLSKKGEDLQNELKNLVGGKICYLTNSGSSSNLIAISSIAKKLGKGAEVIIPACSFPTTVNPIVQNNLMPVFIDSELGTYNSTPELIRQAISPKTGAIIITHTLGNPYPMDEVMKIAREYNLIVLEDCCDALGSKYKGMSCGGFGDLSTYSFYPPHHITMGEGGAVVINNEAFSKLVLSLRDWGRDCWCKPGVSNTCGKRFCWKLGDLPFGYDHKYIFSNIGYNLKPTELQAAIGIEQIKKLPIFEKKRKENFQILYNLFTKYAYFFILPKTLPDADPSWFSFPLTIKDNSKFSRLEFTQFLEENKIPTRTAFSGNITRQPAYSDVKYRISGNLKNSDKIMEDTFFLGIYPGITEEVMNHFCQKIKEFMENFKKRYHFQAKDI
jgi:CDP-4-dehydro-6-deoxyglucose reductase, E1